jgi:transglutaminase-like putative cysteine protease
MRLRISHTTTYRYQPAATGVIQVLRMTPGSHDGQYVAEWQIDLSADAKLDMHHDAFGNITHVLTIGPTDDLTITAEGLIETTDTGGVMRGTDERFPPQLFLRSTELTEASAPMQAFARDLRKDDDDVIAFLHLLMNAINEYMTFDSDPTHSGTTAAEAFTLRRGVCQDYAHVFIACARVAHVPARFVAGHFMRADGEVHQDAGHAWAEAYVPSLGWVGFDPANAICSTDAHARFAIGLDYLGAAPVRGTRYGGGHETLSVAIKVDHAGRQSQSQSQ